MKFKILFIIQLLITGFKCQVDICALSEMTIDSTLTCLPNSKIKDMTSLYSVEAPWTCNDNVEGQTNATFNITLSNGCKATLSIINQPLKVVTLNGNLIAIQSGTLIIDGEEVPFYRKFISLNNDEDACCSPTGLTYRESIYYYFGVFGKKYLSHCLGNYRVYNNPGIH